jgi:hypothetical protein
VAGKLWLAAEDCHFEADSNSYFTTISFLTRLPEMVLGVNLVLLTALIAASYNPGSPETGVAVITLPLSSSKRVVEQYEAGEHSRH